MKFIVILLLILAKEVVRRRRAKFPLLFPLAFCPFVPSDRLNPCKPYFSYNSDAKVRETYIFGVYTLYIKGDIPLLKSILNNPVSFPRRGLNTFEDMHMVLYSTGEVWHQLRGELTQIIRATDFVTPTLRALREVDFSSRDPAIIAKLLADRSAELLFWNGVHVDTSSYSQEIHNRIHHIGKKRPILHELEYLAKYTTLKGIGLNQVLMLDAAWRLELGTQYAMLLLDESNLRTPTVPALSREVQTDTFSIDGVHVPRGTRLILDMPFIFGFGPTMCLMAAVMPKLLARLGEETRKMYVIRKQVKVPERESWTVAWRYKQGGYLSLDRVYKSY